MLNQLRTTANGFHSKDHLHVIHILSRKTNFSTLKYFLVLLEICEYLKFLLVHLCFRLKQHMDRLHEEKLNLREYPHESLPTVTMKEINKWRLASGMNRASRGATAQRSLAVSSLSSRSTHPNKKRHTCDHCPKVSS